MKERTVKLDAVEFGVDATGQMVPADHPSCILDGMEAPLHLLVRVRGWQEFEIVGAYIPRRGRRPGYAPNAERLGIWLEALRSLESHPDVIDDLYMQGAFDRWAPAEEEEYA